MSIALNTNLPETVDPALRRFARNVGAIIDKPIYHGWVGADAQGTVSPNVRRLTYQVRNRRGDALLGRFIVHLWLAATATGAPQGAQTVDFKSGTILETVLGDGEWRVQTDASGQVVMDVTVTGGGTRYLRSFVLSRMDSALLRAEQGPIPFLYSVYYMGNNAVASPTTMGVNPSIFPDPDGFFRHGFGSDVTPEPWAMDQLRGRGLKRFFLLWVWGEEFPGYAVGSAPASYPGGSFTALCNPTNEYRHRTAIGDAYRDRLVAAINVRRSDLSDIIFYSGCVASSAATDDATLDAHSATAELLHATIAYDVQSVLDFTASTSPHVMHTARLLARGIRTIGESWERRDVPEIQGWLGRESGLVADDSGGRPALAISDPASWHTRADVGSSIRMGVLVANNGPSGAARVSTAMYWMGLGYDCYLDFGGLTSDQIAQIISFAEGL